MGCFNVAATVSKISIGSGDKAVFFPLLPSDYSDFKKGDKSIVSMKKATSVCGEGVHNYYRPVFLPIFGEYNDYGQLENIVRDDNVEYIEEYFGITIEDFINQLERGQWGGNCVDIEDPIKDELLKSMSGMFELQSIYFKLISFAKDDKWLGELFWGEMTLQTCKEYLNKFLEEDDDYSDRCLHEMSRSSNLPHAYNYWKYLDYTFSGDHEKPLSDLLYFEKMMYSTNGLYMPAFNGEQHGNIEASKCLLRVSQEALEEQERKYDE